ncbi:MAG: GTP pyrophosphokinase family protein [Lachnospiraceae bacterium]|nr:GTP pyrophosphokinase family protein [Lachnospiraceae bacterium]
MTVADAARSQSEIWRRDMLIYDSALKQIYTKIEILNNEFVHSHRYNPIEHVSKRIKSADSITRKLKRMGYEPTIGNMEDQLHDIAGIRIICSFTSDIYRIAGMLARQDDVAVLKIKDYLKHPKENGYKSYHMVVTVPVFLSTGTVDAKVEIQIRTIAMDFWASLEHKIYYKFEGNAPSHIYEDLKQCADIINQLDQRMLRLNEEVQKLKATAPSREEEI